jgi:hypothetical protein
VWCCDCRGFYLTDRKPDHVCLAPPNQRILHLMEVREPPSPSGSMTSEDRPMGHMAHVRLLIVPTTVMGHMTSVDYFYFGTRGTRVGATSAQSSNGMSDISEPLLLPSTMAVGYLTSTGHCYCGAHGMCVVSNSPNSRDGPSDISGLLPLPYTVATGYMTSDDHCYC